MTEDTKHEAGWYDYAGGKRFFDGEKWTENYAYVPPPEARNYWEQVGIVCLGVLAALFILWVGAQASPENIYLPVKFVVKELPSALG